jgi:tRNA(His) 5'-end guanylyltransferase
MEHIQLVVVVAVPDQQQKGVAVMVVPES